MKNKSEEEGAKTKNKTSTFQSLIYNPKNYIQYSKTAKTTFKIHSSEKRNECKFERILFQLGNYKVGNYNELRPKFLFSHFLRQNLHFIGEPLDLRNCSLRVHKNTKIGWKFYDVLKVIDRFSEAKWLYKFVTTKLAKLAIILVKFFWHSGAKECWASSQIWSDKILTSKFW